MSLIVCTFTALLYFTGPVVASSCLADNNNPCVAENHDILEDHTRSACYNDSGSDYKDDSLLEAGWYRPESTGGTDMPTTAPGPLKCRARNPIWLNGQSVSLRLTFLKIILNTHYNQSMFSDYNWSCLYSEIGICLIHLYTINPPNCDKNKNKYL